MSIAANEERIIIATNEREFLTFGLIIELFMEAELLPFDDPYMVDTS